MKLTEEEMEQAGRARARQLRDEDGLSYREIAAALDAEELRPKHGGCWHPETVRRMLANKTDRPPTLRRLEKERAKRKRRAHDWSPLCPRAADLRWRYAFSGRWGACSGGKVS